MTIGQIFFFIYTSNSSSSHGEEHYFFHFGVLFFSFCSIGNILFILGQLTFCHFSVFCVFNVSPALFLWVPPTIRSAATFFLVNFVFFFFIVRLLRSPRAFILRCNIHQGTCLSIQLPEFSKIRVFIVSPNLFHGSQPPAGTLRLFF